MEGLKPKVLTALMNSKSIKEAAQKAGASERTVYNYLHDDEFIKVYNDAQESLVREAALKLQNGMTEAVEVLLSIAKDKKAGNTARVSAARSILDYGMRSYGILREEEETDPFDFDLRFR